MQSLRRHAGAHPAHWIAAAMLVAQLATGCGSEESTVRPRIPLDSQVGDGDDSAILDGQGDGSDTSPILACTTVEDCPTSNPCLAPQCTDGQCEWAAQAGPCDDSNPCTSQEHCEEGNCVTQEVPCDDENPCTEDHCLSGGCAHGPIDGACEDGDPCTAGDYCLSGACIPGGDTVCDAAGPCQIAVCVPRVGCSSEPVHNAPCDDGDPCTQGDICLQGACTAGAALLCDDGNHCTADICGPQGCAFVAAPGPCDDGNACTTQDQCEDALCVGGPAPQCDDRNPCTADSCAPAFGCVWTFTTASCDDGDACTTGDACSLGQCNPGTPVICDDNNPCTADLCAGGDCSAVPTSGPCEDGDPCTLADSCDNGVCAPGAALMCNDGNPCTLDQCQGGGCVHPAYLGPCDDGNACTQGENCAAGGCGGGLPVDCNDNNSCTADSCVPAVGCVHQAAVSGTNCDDGSVCSQLDVCSSGQCQGLFVLNCDDGNPCTSADCDPLAGCTFAFQGGPCDDGNPCTGGDTCSGGACQAGPLPGCDDGNPCTSDTCNPATGCSHQLLHATACDDGNPCTTGDGCVLGQCLHAGTLGCTDGNPCTTDSCDPALGCVFTPTMGACDDGNACTANDSCVDGQCTGQAVACTPPPPCWLATCAPGAGCGTSPAPAGTPCTSESGCPSTDTCDGAGSCKPGPSPCDDGVACTLDQCIGSGCEHTTAHELCDDGDPCTENACTATGCDFAPITGACDDGNPCTESECVGGDCVQLTDGYCDDGNPCTLDDCNPEWGCQNIPTPGAPCGSNEPCSAIGVCDGAQCVGGSPLVCDDGLPCTTDHCDPLLGCVFTPAPGACAINGQCYENGEQKAGLPCAICLDDVDPGEWSPGPGAECALLYVCGWLTGLDAPTPWPTAGFCQARPYASPTLALPVAQAIPCDPIDGAIVGQPVVSGDGVFAVSQLGWIAKYNFQGERLWQTRLTGAPREPVIGHTGVLWVATTGGVLAGFNTQTGDVVATTNLLGSAAQSPLVTTNRVIVPLQQGLVQAFDHNLNFAWLHASGGVPTAPLALSTSGEVLLGLSSGLVQALSQGGGVLWSVVLPGPARHLHPTPQGIVATSEGSAPAVSLIGADLEWSIALHTGSKPLSLYLGTASTSAWAFTPAGAAVQFDVSTGALISQMQFASPAVAALSDPTGTSVFLLQDGTVRNHNNTWSFLIPSQPAGPLAALGNGGYAAPTHDGIFLLLP